MTMPRVLFEGTDDSLQEGAAEEPVFFGDLNLDQVIASITAGKQEYNLRPLFYTPVDNVNTIQYRHEVMQDLEGKTLLADMNAFAQSMSTVRRYIGLIDKLHYRYHKQGWFLAAVDAYCDAVTRLLEDLSRADIKSRGLLTFREYLTRYASSETFTSLLAETRALRAELSAIRYGIIIKGSLIKVLRYDDEPDYSVEVEATFEKFKQGAVKDYRVKLNPASGMNHIEAQILGLVAKLFPEGFSRLNLFCAQHNDFLDETIRVFDRDIQFYVAYLEFIAPIQQAGLRFCYPQVSPQNKEIYSNDGFDLALAAARVRTSAPLVVNDFFLRGPERLLIVSGPNQGGKTTFARAFGQLHYLASLGCPVPGRSGQLFLFDRLFTHFEREESVKTLRGKLQDDLMRVHAVLDEATPRSILILNEIFSSTTLQDEVFLSQKVIERISQLDLLGVWVTFVDELASFSEQTVSMVSTVAPENPAIRTYKILRRTADGLAYAMSIAEKHRLTYECLKERIQS